ncbi:hypothetical protein CTTA_4463 [Comamonas testosteroni]|uniref:Uncharacterized protein n=1 Tax=Comamonas testosteroni TaxID=285 RepID=A0A5A7MHY5_COMTE|nr:hypothetical protein CTTA_4463 [Comamonas testosteroni]
MGFFCDVVAGAAGQGALRPCIECTRGELHHVSSMLTHPSLMSRMHKPDPKLPADSTFPRI